MKQWLLNLVLDWLAKNLTKEMVKEWADKARLVLFPLLRSWKDSVIQMARAAAAKSDTTIDDAAVDALDWFLEALLPDNPKVL